METLHNELLTVEVSDLGAELQSIKDDEGKAAGAVLLNMETATGDAVRLSSSLLYADCGKVHTAPKATPIRWDATDLHAT